MSEQRDLPTDDELRQAAATLRRLVEIDLPADTGADATLKDRLELAAGVLEALVAQEPDEPA